MYEIMYEDERQPQRFTSDSDDIDGVYESPKSAKSRFCQKALS